MNPHNYFTSRRKFLTVTTGGSLGLLMSYLIDSNKQDMKVEASKGSYIYIVSFAFIGVPTIYRNRENLSKFVVDIGNRSSNFMKGVLYMTFKVGDKQYKSNVNFSIPPENSRKSQGQLKYLSTDITPYLDKYFAQLSK